MEDRKLKHFKAYVSRLMLFAKAMNIRVEKSDTIDSDGVWMPSIRKIQLAYELSQSYYISCFLHELGHSMDDMLSKDSKQHRMIVIAYAAAYSGKHTKNQLKLVLRVEKQAWKNGRDIAKRLNIRLGKWYDEAERICIKDYRSS